ncbi:MAG: hypothetical protein Q9P01_13555 [Anaerolineae bacterium]|nr:hypothetical protein [Anaerolineae bacterium]
MLDFKLPDSVLMLQVGQRLRVDVDITSRKPPLIGAPERTSLYHSSKIAR